MDLDIDRIAKLARISLSDAEKEKYSKDLAKILDHFMELKKLDTENVLPMSGGTDLKNVLRKDSQTAENASDVLRKAFPDSKNGYLKVPKVFE